MSYTSVRPFPLLALLLLAPAAASAQAAATAHPAQVPEIAAVASGAPITLDGRLDEAAWSAARPAGGFVQTEPKEGEAATQRTEVRFLYDAEALYVGARMYDDQGARGVRTQLVRRDAFPESDWLRVA